ncbi:hypothetical protein STRCR_0165 [Streptococcus criceti HS-6]|uniref:Integral membrane protein n=2 Tax=Streptococcus criceti TaxID=1333 RepID=G5JNC8_STRCG|nr:hypothetical protein STRCR_0165 [Streptococcus criceti HS-6]
MNSIHDILTTKEMLTHHNGLITGVHITFYISPLVQTGGLVLGLIAASTILGFLHFIDNRKDENVLASVFAGFTEGRIWAFILTWILQYIFTLLWTLLLIIPGIIKAYSYAMSIYIVDDLKRQGKNLSATEAITRSKHLMKGHKWELFVLDLSFLGWWFLATLTLGIGYLWLYPYILTTRAEFYRGLIAQNPTVLAD